MSSKLLAAVLFSAAVVSACAANDSAPSQPAPVAAPTAPSVTTDVVLEKALASTDASINDAQDAGLDELDPFDANIDKELGQMDEVYEQETGSLAHLPSLAFFGTGCRRESCAVYARVSKSTQSLELFVNGVLYGTFATSTGVAGRGTPNFDKHPDGRVYDRYTSKKFPGGDFNGLGNMPYAVFIGGGFAIHGTGKGNWSKLGRPASHGCIRIHPDNALTFNRLVREYGVSNTWITVQ